MPPNEKRNFGPADTIRGSKQIAEEIEQLVKKEIDIKTKIQQVVDEQEKNIVTQTPLRKMQQIQLLENFEKELAPLEGQIETLRKEKTKTDFIEKFGEEFDALQSAAELATGPNEDSREENVNAYYLKNEELKKKAHELNLTELEDRLKKLEKWFDAQPSILRNVV